MTITNLYLHKELKNFYQLLPILLVSVLIACQDQQRERNGILSESTMVDVLYDYQLAIALASEDAQDGNLADVEYRYTQGVMKKYGITDDEYNISLAHYAREPKQMLAITEKVSKRFAKEFEENGTIPGGELPLTSNDTTVIWKNSRGTILSANHNNHLHYSIPIQNAVSCNRAVFSFHTNWIYRQNQKCGGVLITAVFDNDSTTTYNETIRDFTSKQDFSIPVPQERKLKNLEFHIYQSARWQKEPQLLGISNLSLFAVSTKKSKQSAKAQYHGPRS